MTYITLDKDYGYTPYSVSGLSSGSVIDATKASWIEDNSSIDYPDATHSTTSGTGQISTYPFKVKDAVEEVVEEGR